VDWTTQLLAEAREMKMAIEPYISDSEIKAMPVHIIKMEKKYGQKAEKVLRTGSRVHDILAHSKEAGPLALYGLIFLAMASFLGSVYGQSYGLNEGFIYMWLFGAVFGILGFLWLVFARVFEPLVFPIEAVFLKRALKLGTVRPEELSNEEKRDLYFRLSYLQKLLGGDFEGYKEKMRARTKEMVEGRVDDKLKREVFLQ
jgi:hypothetical protein